MYMHLSEFLESPNRFIKESLLGSASIVIEAVVLNVRAIHGPLVISSSGTIHDLRSPYYHQASAEQNKGGGVMAVAQGLSVLMLHTNSRMQKIIY
jgi:hypothetical protein